jgi:hypothetical protein
MAIGAHDDDISMPAICIPYAKMNIGCGDVKRDLTSQFIQDAFGRYGDVESVIMNARSRKFEDGCVEHYYHVCVVFKRWHIENGEARYVRSVMLSPNPMANIKLVYDGPRYWKFYSARVMQA